MACVLEWFQLQIMKIGLEAGIRFTPEQWSSLLYGDTSQKPLMQSIIG